MHCKAWESHFSTGVASVDHEHHRLRSTIEALCGEISRADSPEPVLEGLGLLYERACAHSALEASVAGALVGRDVEMLERIGIIMDAFYEGSCAACDQSLDQCLHSWFEKHLQSGHLLRAAT